MQPKNFSYVAKIFLTDYSKLIFFYSFSLVRYILSTLIVVKMFDIILWYFSNLYYFNTHKLSILIGVLLTNVDFLFAPRQPNILVVNRTLLEIAIFL